MYSWEAPSSCLASTICLYLNTLHATVWKWRKRWSFEIVSLDSLAEEQTHCRKYHKFLQWSNDKTFLSQLWLFSWKQWQTIFLDSKITADGDCSHEIKRRLLLGRKAMTNLDNVSKSRDITLLTKVHIVKAMVFPVVMYGCEFSSVQFSSLSRVRLFATPWTAAHQASLSITNSQSPPKPMSIESVMPFNRLILCRPLLLLPSLFPSIRIFSNESTLHEVAKVLEFQLQHQSFQWTPRTDLL